jgi:arylsulfatase A-like enzyme
MTPQNVLFILTDDQGYGDLSCMGSATVRTPRIDALAAAGARCTAWYSGSAVCSPSRACLLTGRYPGNAGVRSILGGTRTTSGLSPHVPTLARLLGDAGYATFLSGKWHLGGMKACWPQHHGFQRWFGFVAGCVDYFSHIFYHGANHNGSNPYHDLWEDGEERWLEGGYLTELITERAIGYIRDAARDDKPFFGYVAYNAPHYPMHAPEKYRARFSHLPWDKQIYAAMMSAVDDGVGAILDELERQGRLDDTIIVFTSDNGPSRETRNCLDGTMDPYYGGLATGLKGHKFSLFDGGIRVPGLVRWTRGLPAGTVCDEPVGSFDVAPTVLRACGVGIDGLELDGADMRGILAGEARPERELHWELGGQNAIRRGRWKLVLKGQLIEKEGPAAEVHLADIVADRAESTNLAGQHPQLVAELSAKALAWRERVDARWKSEFHEGKATGITALAAS